MAAKTSGRSTLNAARSDTSVAKRSVGRPKKDDPAPAGVLVKLELMGPEQARERAAQAAEKAFKTLEGLLTSPRHSVRLGAAVAILNRAYGLPAQAVQLTGKDGESLKIETIVRHIIQPPDAEPVPVTIEGETVDGGAVLARRIVEAISPHAGDDDE